MREDSKSYLAAALFILALILCAGISLLTRQINRLEDEPPPTLAISETPSITPIPPTLTLPPSVTSVVTVATLTAGTGTAVTPPDTHTAVPTATATDTPAPTGTPTPTPTATDERLLIKPGTTYWGTAKGKYGRFDCWQMLKRVNGWPERSLPVGEYMRLPETCE